jgi:ribosomal protein L7/L12
MSLTRAEVIAYLEGLGSLELGALIDALQQRLGLAPVAAPPVLVTMGAPLYITADDDDDDRSVRLTAIGPRKVRVLQALRERLPLSLADAMQLLAKLPVVVATGLHPTAASELKDLLREAGAEVEDGPRTRHD